MVLFVLRAASRGATQIDSARNVYAKPFAFQRKYAITISMALSDWPDSYNFATDTVCQSVFLPFIEGEMAALKAYDAKRPADRTYIFPEHAQRVADLTQKTVLHMGFGERLPIICIGRCCRMILARRSCHLRSGTVRKSPTPRPSVIAGLIRCWARRRWTRTSMTLITRSRI